MNIPLVDFGGILFFGVLFLVAALNIYGSIYNAFSHSGGNKKNPVSYTHLTLPTICSV